MAVLDDFASKLGNLKKLYSTGAPDALADIQKQGLQLRSQASGQGVDLGALEDAANTFAGIKTNNNSADEQAFRSSIFNQVKASPVYKDMTAASSGVPSSQMNFRNEDMEQGHQLLTQLKQIMATPFSYNPNSDPLVAAAKSNADKRATLAVNDSNEDMNSRGILNSTVTSDRAAQIRNDSADSVTAMLPQFAQMAYGQHQQEVSNLSGLASSFLNSGIDERNFAANRSDVKASQTGTVMDPEAQAILNHLLSLKQTAENPWTTSDQLKQYGSLADQDRAKLSSYGIDPSLFSSDVDYKDAAANASKVGTRTLAGKTFDQNSANSQFQNLFNTATSGGMIPVGFADEVAKIPGMESIAPYFKGLEGKPTVQGKQVDISQQNANTSAYNATKSSEPKPISYSEQKQQATDFYISQALANSSSKDEALGYLNSPEIRQKMAANGADFPTIKAQLDKYYPDAKSTTPESASAILALNKEARKMAMDEYDGDVEWSRLPEEEKDRLTDLMKSKLQRQ